MQLFWEHRWLFGLQRASLKNIEEHRKTIEWLNEPILRSGTKSSHFGPQATSQMCAHASSGRSPIWVVTQVQTKFLRRRERHDEEECGSDSQVTGLPAAWARVFADRSPVRRGRQEWTPRYADHLQLLQL